MAKVLVPIADGTEELEAVTIIDILRRAEADVTVASVMPARKAVIASRGVKLEADCLLLDCLEQDWDLIVLPGGIPGAEHLGACQELLEILADQLQHNRLVAAICAAPAVVLAENSLIDMREATCYPGYAAQLESNGATLVPGDVVIDRNLITSKGPGTAMAFAIKLVEILFGQEKTQAVAAAALVELQ